MPNWKKVITSGSNANLNQITASNGRINGQMIISGASAYQDSSLTLIPTASSAYGLLITGSTFNGIPLALIQTSGSGTSGQGEFIYGKGKDGEDSFRLRQGAGGAGTFQLYSSASDGNQHVSHNFEDPFQGGDSYVNYSADSRSDAYFGIGLNNPSAHLHVSGNGKFTGEVQVGTSTVLINGDAGTVSASGHITASDLYVGGTGTGDASLNIDGHITASGAVSASGTGLFGALKINGTDYLGNPTTLSELDESTDATDDKIILWDQNASAWKYMTLDNLQDSIDTTGGGGGTPGGSDTQVQFNDGGSFGGDAGFTYDKDDNSITAINNITASGTISASGGNHTLGGFQIIESSDSGSIAVSGSVKIQPQTTVPALSESRLYNVTSENGLVVDDLHFGTAGLTPAYTYVTLDDDGTAGTGELIYGVGSAVTSTTYNMRVAHDTSTTGTRIYSQLTGVYKVTGNFVIEGLSATYDSDIKVDGSDVHTYQARVHSAVDPVERTQIYVGTINSGSYVTATIDATSTANVNYELGSVLLVERLS